MNFLFSLSKVVKRILSQKHGPYFNIFSVNFSSLKLKEICLLLQYRWLTLGILHLKAFYNKKIIWSLIQVFATDVWVNSCYFVNDKYLIYSKIPSKIVESLIEK